MKTCMCCNVRSGGEAIACANCGEASWSQNETVEAKDETDPSEGFASPSSIGDPDASVEVPRVRRNKRPN